MITHNVSTIQVFMTDRYQNFTTIEGNRGINQHKINKIIKDIEGGNDMLQYYPIQVKLSNQKLEILDGQHRYFICKKLKRPVYYIMVSEKKEMADIARLNSNTEKWTSKNYINCYTTKGNDNYKKLQKFIDEYNFNVGTSLNLLAFGQPGTEGGLDTLRDKFEHGKFEVLKWKEAVGLATEVKKFADFPYHTDRGFIIAIYKIRKAELITIDQLLAAYKKASEMLEKRNSYKDYVMNLEAIVNKNKQKRVVIT